MSRRPDKVVIPETTEAQSKLDMALDEINNRAQRSASRRASRAKRQREEEDEGPDDSDVEEIVRKDGPFASREITKRPRLEAVNDSDLIKVVSRGGVLRDVYNKEDPESQDFVTHSTLQTLGMSSSEQNLIKMTAGVIERNKVQNNGEFKPMMAHFRQITNADKRRRMPPAFRRKRLEDMHKAILEERRLALAPESANEADTESVAGSTTSAATIPAASATTAPATGPAAAPAEPVSQAASRGNHRGGGDHRYSGRGPRSGGGRGEHRGGGGWYSGGRGYGHDNRGWRSNHRGYGYRGRGHTYWDHPGGGSRGAGNGPRDYQGPAPTAPRRADPPVPPAPGGSRPPAPPMPHGGPGQAWKQWAPNTKPRTEYQVEELDDEMMNWRVENGLDKPRQKDDTMDYEQGS